MITELKVLPTQPDTYSIPEEEEDDEDRLEAEDKHDGEGVEVSTAGFSSAQGVGSSSGRLAFGAA